MNDWPADPRLDAGLRRLVDSELEAARNDAVGPMPRPNVHRGRNGLAFAGLGFVAAIAIVASLALRGAGTGLPAAGGPSASHVAGTSPSPRQTPAATHQPDSVASGATETVPPINPVATTTPSPWFLPTGAPTHLHDTATLLLDGRVLFAGGYDPEVTGFLSTAEIYDPATGKCTPTGSMALGRVDETATRLLDGRVLFAGGLIASANPNEVTKSAEIYDPKTGKFTVTGSMVEARQFHTATLLRDGRVLITGGFDANRPAIAPMAFHPGFAGQPIRPDMVGGQGDIASAELYDPATGKFSLTGPMSEGRDGHTAALLPDGRVLVFGLAHDGGGDPTDTSAEVYDPKTGKFSLTGSLNDPRAYAHTTPLVDGRILVTDGSTDGRSAELYDEKTGKFTRTGETNVSRSEFSATLLSNGRVLIVGGYDLQNRNTLSSAEIYDPAMGEFSAAGSMTIERLGPLVTLLSDGRVLIVGGGYVDAADGLVRSAELYVP